jgi:histidinol phosphatase-like PHP family hydrolase
VDDLAELGIISRTPSMRGVAKMGAAYNDVALMAAKERGLRIVIGTGAHTVEELKYMEFGIYQARRSGLEAADVAKAHSLARFRDLL